MARAHLFRPITDREGNLLYGATVTVREVDYAIPVAQPLFASSAGDEVLDNPLTVPLGVIDFWLDIPQRVSILVQADGMRDILVYLDAMPAPEEVVSSGTPLAIVNTPGTSGQVLLSTETAGQAQWGNPPVGTGLTPVVVASSQNFTSGADPAGWTFTGGIATTHSYDPGAIPPGTNYTYSLHGRVTAANGVLTVTGPSFTLLESGRLALWMKTALQTAESFAIQVVGAGPTTTTLATASASRDWGFYAFTLAAGTYTPKLVYTGAPTYDPAAGHDVWMTGYVAQYGGSVPPHAHGGTGADSLALGTSAVASATSTTAVGATAQATMANATALGYGAQATGSSALAAGMNARANADFSVAVGAGASGSSSTTAWTAVGYNASATGLESVAAGKSAVASGSYAVAVGSAAIASADSTVALGQGAQALAASGVALGSGAVVGASHTNSVALGSGAATTGANQVVLGNPGAMTIIPGSFQNYGLVSLGAQDSRVGFYGSTGSTRQTILGSDDGNVTLRTLVQAFAAMGLVVNQSIQQPAPFQSPVGAIDYFYRQDPGDGTLGSADFDYQPYTYAPLAFTSTGPYPSGPQWYVGSDHNGYKGVASSLGALKNVYRPAQALEIGTFIQAASTGNKICLVLRHTGQTDGTAAAAYLILDQAAGTIALGVKAPGTSADTYTVASGNSQNLAALGLTAFDGGIHKHRVFISGQTVMYFDSSTLASKPVFFYDPALNATGTYAGVDFNALTALNTVSFLPQASFAHFRVVGALTNLASGEAWQTAVSGTGAAVTVSATNNLQTTGAAAGYAIAYFLSGANTLSKTVQTQYTGTLQAASGILGRIQDPNNHYLVNATTITKVAAGSQTTLATHSSAFVTGDTMRVTFGGTAGAITVFKNGVQVSTATDSAFLAQNRFGVGIRGAGAANWPYLFVNDAYNAAVVYK